MMHIYHIYHLTISWGEMGERRFSKVKRYKMHVSNEQAFLTSYSLPGYFSTENSVREVLPQTISSLEYVEGCKCAPLYSIFRIANLFPSSAEFHGSHLLR